MGKILFDELIVVSRKKTSFDLIWQMSVAIWWALTDFCNEHNEMLIEIKAYPWNLEESSIMSIVIRSSWDSHNSFASLAGPEKE